MNTRQLKIPPASSLIGFTKVCQHLNISKASQDLCMTQAAVSRQINTLERFLGVSLFDRYSHGVVLTPEGERFAHTVLPAVDSIKQAVDALVSPLSPMDHLNVFAKGCISVQWLTPNIYRFQDGHPRAKIRIFSSTNSMDAKANQIDIGMQYGPMNQRGFEHKGKWADQVIIVCSPELKRRIPEVSSVEELPDYPLIHLDGDNRAIWSWEQFFSKFGIDSSASEIQLAFNNYQNAIDAALLGKGLLLGTRFILNRSLQEGKLERIGRFSTPSKHHVYLYIRSSTCTSSVALDFINWIQTEVSSILGTP